MSLVLPWSELVGSDGLDCSGILKEIANTIRNTVIPSLEVVPLTVHNTEVEDVRVKPYFALSRREKICLPIIGQLSQLIKLCPYKTPFPESGVELYGPRTKLKVPLLVCAKASIALVAQSSRQHEAVCAFISMLKHSFEKSVLFGMALYEFVLTKQSPSAELAQKITDKYCTFQTAPTIGELITNGLVVICKTEDLMVERKVALEKEGKLIPPYVRWPNGRKKITSKK
jgi:hypothetical protein